MADLSSFCVDRLSYVFALILVSLVNLMFDMARSLYYIRIKEYIEKSH